MRPWKNHLVVLVIALMGVSLLIFAVTGYTALYWAWLRGNLEAALPYLPWARNFGMLAMAWAAAALMILFLPKGPSDSAEIAPCTLGTCHCYDRPLFRV